MAGILRPQPYTIHFLKKNPDCSFPFISVSLFISLLRQLIIIVFQNDPGDQPAQFTNISKNFLLQTLS